MVYIAFSESFQPKKFVRCWNKVERKYIQEQQPNQFHSYNQNMGFVSRMDKNVAKYRIGIQMKKWWWSPFVWMVDKVHGYYIVLTKIKAMSLCLFWFFKEMLFMQFFWNIQGKANFPPAIEEFEISHQIFMMTQNIIRCNLECRCIQNPLKYLRWSLFA